MHAHTHTTILPACIYGKVGRQERYTGTVIDISPCTHARNARVLVQRVVRMRAHRDVVYYLCARVQVGCLLPPCLRTASFASLVVFRTSSEPHTLQGLPQQLGHTHTHTHARARARTHTFNHKQQDTRVELCVDWGLQEC